MRFDELSGLRLEAQLLTCMQLGRVKTELLINFSSKNGRQQRFIL